MRLNFRSIEGLQNSIEMPDLKTKNLKMILKSMQNLYKAALEKYKEKNLEDTYVYLFKYMVLFDFVKSSRDNQYIRSINEKRIEIRDALELLEKLSDELSEIYLELGKSSTVNLTELNMKKETMPLNQREIKQPTPKKINNLLWIGIEDLQETLKHNDTFKYIILDTRPESDYMSSHLLSLENVNMPVDQFPVGISADKLQIHLSNKSKLVWRERNKYNLIILLGENDSPKACSESVKQMYSIITKWDPNTNYKSEPVVLDGGYCRFRFIFPMLCSITNKLPIMNHEQDNIINLGEIQYPLIEPEGSESNIEIEYPDLEIKLDNSMCISPLVMPKFDRSLKPSYEKLVTSITKNVEIIDVKDASDTTEDELTNYAESIPEKKTSEVPNFDRRKKPQRRSLNNLDPVYGYSPQGFTGMKNFSNNCYINSVCQILTHIPQIYELFVSNIYKKYLNKQNGGQGKLTVAFADLCTGIWAENFSVISCRELKALVGSLNPRFLGDSQEDAHEFFIYLINFLHEELAVTVTKSVKNVADLSWLSFTKGQQSVIYDLFYGQMLTSIICSSCENKNTHYSLYGGLTLEITPKTRNLHECLDNHFLIEKIDDYNCEKCNCKTHILKKSVIRKLPPVLLIHLKRFRNFGEETSKNRYCIDFANSLTIEDANTDFHQYCLIGVITHVGTLNQGHYKAYVMHQDKWIVCDDTNISIVEDLFKVRNVKRDVYLLFYQKM